MKKPTHSHSRAFTTPVGTYCQERYTVTAINQSLEEILHHVDHIQTADLYLVTGLVIARA